MIWLSESNCCFNSWETICGHRWLQIFHKTFSSLTNFDEHVSVHFKSPVIILCIQPCDFPFSFCAKNILLPGQYYHSSQRNKWVDMSPLEDLAFRNLTWEEYVFSVTWYLFKLWTIPLEQHAMLLFVLIYFKHAVFLHTSIPRYSYDKILLKSIDSFLIFETSLYLF